MKKTTLNERAKKYAQCQNQPTSARKGWLAGYRAAQRDLKINTKGSKDPNFWPKHDKKNSRATSKVYGSFVDKDAHIWSDAPMGLGPI